MAAPTEIKYDQLGIAGVVAAGKMLGLDPSDQRLIEEALEARDKSLIDTNDDGAGVAIPDKWAHLIVVASLRTEDTVNIAGALRFNNDSTAGNYDFMLVYGNTTSITVTGSVSLPRMVEGGLHLPRPTTSGATSSSSRTTAPPTGRSHSRCRTSRCQIRRGHVPDDSRMRVALDCGDHPAGARPG